MSMPKPYQDNGQEHPALPFTYIAGQPFEYEVNVDQTVDYIPQDMQMHVGMTVKQLKRLQSRVHWKYSSPAHDT